MSEAHRKYRPDIDGLRAVAVLAVVFHHISARFVSGGYIGVDVFFVISGYLITGIIHREILAGTFTFAGFYERRIRRIFPALFVVLIAVLAVGWFVYLPSDYLATLRAALGTVLFSANLVFWRDLQEGYFAADAKQNPVLHMWSLGVEEQFYVFFPIMLMLVMRYARGQLKNIMICVSVVSLTAAAALVHTKPVATFFLLPFRAWELSIGGLLAVTAIPQPKSRYFREGIGWLALLAIVLPMFVYTPETTFPGLSALPPVLGTAVLIYLGSGHQTKATVLLTWRPAVLVGLISYSLYLWHWPVIVYTKYLLRIPSFGSWIPVIFTISLVLAYLSYRFVEVPARRSKARLGRQGVIASGVVSMALLSTAIGAGFHTNGFESRWPASAVDVDRTRTARVPFKACESRLEDIENGLCIVGDPAARPDTLLWGDSHMLAWLPGFDVALRQLGRSAFAAPNSACPPILDVDNKADPACRRQNDAVLARLQDSSIRQVVLAGYWSKYFLPSNLALSSARYGEGNATVTPAAFRHTLAVLTQSNRGLIVLGPVPTYQQDVPLAVARYLSDPKVGMTHTTLNDVRLFNASFYTFMRQVDAPNVFFVDVANWMCTPKCVVYDKKILYRDANHLSQDGAVRYSYQLAQLLSHDVPVLTPTSAASMDINQ